MYIINNINVHYKNSVLIRPHGGTATGICTATKSKIPSNTA